MKRNELPTSEYLRTRSATALIAILDAYIGKLYNSFDNEIYYGHVPSSSWSFDHHAAWVDRVAAEIEIRKDKM